MTGLHAEIGFYFSFTIMQLLQLLAHNHDLERKAVLDLDAIVHKVTQEISEVLELIQYPTPTDLPHLIEEIGDALTNILSVQYRLDPEHEIPTPMTMDCSGEPLALALAHGKRNDLVQKHRGIYARQTVPLEIVSKQTALLIGQLISLAQEKSGKQYDLASLIAPTVQKFIERAEAYGPHINLSDHIRDIADYPKPGILFKDITPLLKHPRAFAYTIQELCEQAKDADVIV